MKYIRTNYSVYEVTDKQYDLLCGNLTEEEKDKYKNITSISVGDFKEGTYKSIFIKDIIRISENLEELYDSYVVVCDNEAMVMNKHLSLKEIMKSVNYYEEKDNITIYGCIWTSKGLIYVAKMNDKGELELI